MAGIAPWASAVRSVMPTSWPTISPTNGVRAVAVHSGERSAPRASALEALADGRLDILFAVDMFNEGLDIPNVDTVLMLRPTESSVIWLQQFGRGLRRAEGKSELRVIDYIGNHRAFLIKVRSLLQPLLGTRRIRRGDFGRDAIAPAGAS